MKFRLALAIGAPLVLASMLLGTANAAGVTVTVPAGPPGTVQATVNGQPCGSVAVSPTSPATLVLADSCAIAGATVTFTASNGVPLRATVTIPASASGNVVLPDLAAAQPVTIQIPAVANASGSVNAMVNGGVCATSVISSNGITTLTLPATCATPGATISFTGAGGVPFGTTLTVPMNGGATLTLPSVASAKPVTVTLPSGSDTLTVKVDGQPCGLATLGASGSTIVLPAMCATPNGNVTFTTSDGQVLLTVLSVPASGGTIALPSLKTSAFLASPVFSPNGLAIVVANRGTVDDVEASATAAGAKGVWAQDGTGQFRLLVIGGPAFINGDFRAAFNAGFAVATGLTLVR